MQSIIDNLANEAMGVSVRKFSFKLWLKSVIVVTIAICWY